MKDIKIGVQLYTLRDHIKNYEDTDKTFSYLKNELKVDTVQISAIGDIEPKKVAELVEKNGFDVCVTHKPWDRIVNDLDALIEEHKMLGCNQIGLGALSEEYRSSLEDVRRFLALADTAGEKLKKHGMTFAYHNHAFEFTRLEDGRTLFDVLVQESNPESFYFIPDTYWLHMGGVDETEYIKKLKGRVKVCHFKDWAVKRGENVGSITELGCGNINLDACYQACKEAEIPYIVYEQDDNFINGNALEACAISYKNLVTIHERNK